MEFKVIRQKITTRGGGVEIDLTPLGFDGHRMSAYQNYLGGGMLGSIQVNDTIRSQVSNVRLQLDNAQWFNDELQQLKRFIRHEMSTKIRDVPTQHLICYIHIRCTQC